MKTKELIGRRLKRIRQRKKLTQENLAEKVGISPKYISSIERGQENPTLDTLIKIVHALEVEMGEVFLTENEESDPKKNRELVRQLLKEADGEELRKIVRVIQGILH